MLTRPALLFLGAFAAILTSYTALSIAPRLQIATVEPTRGTEPYSSLEELGRRVYIREGCIYCHSQQVRAEGYGSDVARGWGPRGSLPGDYVFDRPHLLGTMRTGPDLHDIASRQPSRDWQLAHLYQPRSVSPGSIMPPYPWLFEVKRRSALNSSDRIVPIAPAYAPSEGRVVVPTEEAEALYAYLMTLKLEAVRASVTNDAGNKE